MALTLIRISLITMLLLACGAGRPTSAPSASAQQKADALRLTSAQPLLRISVPGDVARDRPAVLEVLLEAIDNPKSLGFNVAAYLETPGRERVAIGTFAAFPVDQPGRFRLRASDAFDKLRASQFDPAKDKLDLLLELQAAAEAGLQDVAVDVGEIRWSREPSR